MSSLPAWRSLHSVMILTVYVALGAYLIRVTVGTGSLLDSCLVGVPVALTFAVFGIWPITKFVARAFEPSRGPGDGPCRACGCYTKQPLYRRRSSAIPELTGYRCTSCGTTYRVVGGMVVEEPRPTQAGTMPEDGIWFEGRAGTSSEPAS